MKKYKFLIKGHEYEVEILSFEHDTAELEVNGTPYCVEVVVQRDLPKTKTPKLVRQAVPQPKPEESAIPKPPRAEQSVKAPLPGIILKILVKKDDVIKRGDPLLIMEAMKMENTIQAEKDGVISAIIVKEGDTVLQNDVLLEIR